jgi:serine/threonine-protein kinase
MTPTPELRAGQQLMSYTLVEPLGEGASASIWRAEGPEGPVALKWVGPAFEGFAQQEVRALGAAGEHEAVVGLRAVMQEQELEGVGLVLELVEGDTLADLLRAGGVPLHRALAVVASAADGLAHLHARGVVHRDVKAANLMVRPDGTAVWIDLGLASVGGEASEGQGSVHTMPPEQIAEEPVGAPADVYSLGAVLYRAVAGRYPFHSANVVEVLAQHRQAPMPPLPPEARLPAPVQAVLVPLLERMLAKSPEERPSAAEVAQTLRQLVPHAEPEGFPWHLVGLSVLLIGLVSLVGLFFT